MDDRLHDLYALPADVYLEELSERCAIMEQRVREVAERLSEKDRQIIEAYIDMKDELEFQSVKTALRFGKQQASGPDPFRTLAGR